MPAMVVRDGAAGRAGWRYDGRVQGRKNRAATSDKSRDEHRGRLWGTETRAQEARAQEARAHEARTQEARDQAERAAGPRVIAAVRESARPADLRTNSAVCRAISKAMYTIQAVVIFSAATARATPANAQCRINDRRHTRSPLDISSHFRFET